MTDYLNNEKERLTSIIRQEKRQLATLPEGKLTLTTSNNTYQYFINKTYVSKKDISVIKKIAQKEYDQKVLATAEEKLKIVDKLIKLEDPEIISSIYQNLSNGRKVLVKPVEETQEQYEKKWQELKYEGNPLRPQDKVLLTERGEMVRSKSELIIANTLASNNICYRYEYPIYLGGGKCIYPDFFILNSRTREEFVLEHFGMMDNQEYRNGFFAKLNTYLSLGYVFGKNLFATFESSIYTFNYRHLNALIENFFK